MRRRRDPEDTMDPMPIAGAALEKAVDSTAPLLQKLFGPASEEIGSLWGDRIREYRLRRVVEGLERTQRWLDSKGIQPKAIPPRTLSVLLEGMSLEDDDNLSEMWAGLMAAAASGDKYATQPIFAHILKEMSPLDAVVFEYFVRDLPEVREAFWSKEKFEVWEADSSKLAEELGCSEDEAELSMVNLQRLGLLERQSPIYSESAYLSVPDTRKVHINALGRALAAACMRDR